MYILFVSIIMTCDSFNILYKIDKACECIPNINVLKIFVFAFSVQEYNIMFFFLYSY